MLADKPAADPARAIPAPETDIIPNSVIQPNIFTLTSLHAPDPISLAQIYLS
jgi:hypothetical protein